MNLSLKDVVYINPKTDIKHLRDYDLLSFVPMECVSDEYGEIIENREGQKVNSGGYTKFAEGDLIWARITPCMQNGKSAIVKNLINGLGYGSTEFHVIRSRVSNINIEYVYHLLRLDVVLKDAVNHFTGSAGQQRVPKDYLESLLIPVPPISIQNEICTHLNELKQQLKILRNKIIEDKLKSIKEFENEIFG